VERGKPPQQLASGLLCPPVNVGVRSTPNYAALAAQAVYNLPGGRKVFAGQRGESFHVDLGSIFDLGTLRPFQNLHLIPSAAAAGVNGTQATNVHTIALQVPKRDLTVGGHDPTDPKAQDSVIGVYASAAVSGPRSGTTTTAGNGTARSGRCPDSPIRCSTRSSCRWP
jgi:hypothetical protein